VWRSSTTASTICCTSAPSSVALPRGKPLFHSLSIDLRCVCTGFVVAGSSCVSCASTQPSELAVLAVGARLKRPSRVAAPCLCSVRRASCHVHRATSEQRTQPACATQAPTLTQRPPWLQRARCFKRAGGGDARKAAGGGSATHVRCRPKKNSLPGVRGPHFVEGDRSSVFVPQGRWAVMRGREKRPSHHTGADHTVVPAKPNLSDESASPLHDP
jgi:hypothetical protein